MEKEKHNLSWSINPHYIHLFAVITATIFSFFFQFPGWMVNSEGSVFIATANDNAVGMYTCTAYNSYGTMGQSEPTQVILQVRLGFLAFYHEHTLIMYMDCVHNATPSPFRIHQQFESLLGLSISRRWAES